jgi:hypothetical protein
MTALALPGAVYKAELVMHNSNVGVSEVYYLISEDGTVADLESKMNAIEVARLPILPADAWIDFFRLSYPTAGIAQCSDVITYNTRGSLTSSTDTTLFSEPQGVCLLLRQQSSTPPTGPLTHSPRYLHFVCNQNVTNYSTFDGTVGTFNTGFAAYVTALKANTVLVKKKTVGGVASLSGFPITDVVIRKLSYRPVGRVFGSPVGHRLA